MTIVIDTPKGIEAWYVLSWYHKLKMEVDRPNGPKWRNSPMNVCKTIMEADGYPCPHKRKAKVLETFIIYMKDVKGIEV